MRGNPESAAQIDHFRLPAGFGEEAVQPLERLPRSRRREELGSDVDVEAGERAADAERLLGRHPELRADVAGADRLVRLSFDPGRDTREHPFDAGGARPFELLDRIEDHVRRARLRRGAQLLVRLVVAVDDEPLGGTPAASANRSSPSVDTSAPIPSSARSRMTATFGNAFVP